ncbi:HlyD family secretion protein [uncultured Mediterranea sp.]|uniref:HlyD family secretion protein n=1 Tax=uncultured Mediterranea sp. TaxID=1926662 RepID=UPI002584FAB0|nr:HlyD family secretion protein [uncultured Mediterranea sp.]
METNNTLQEQAKKLRKMRRRQRIASLLGIAVLVWGVVQAALLFLDYKNTETSNDAQVEQYISPVNLRASGYIQKICFTEHQNVHKGDTLLVLDDREYRIRVMEAEAALKDAMAGATVMDATLQTTQNNASVFEASIAEVEIRLAKLEKDRQRYTNLLKRNAATPIQLEQIETEYEATCKKLDALKRQQKAARSGVNEVSQRRQNIEASIQRAQAALDMARLNLSYCVVTAPCDGKLGRRALEEGQFIGAGQTITYILPDTQKWIVANYKETQVENLTIGQQVRISVDAIKDREFTGRITAISGATGSKYSLVPTDNSAGNFVKIQQRIPVRIDFDDLSREDNERLAAGMMVVVKTIKN